MATPRLTITKEKETRNTSAVFIDTDLIDAVNAIKQESGVSIQRIVEKFVKYGIENVEIIED